MICHENHWSKVAANTQSVFYSVQCDWILWQIRHFRDNMKTPSILTLGVFTLLTGLSWVGARSALALQDPPPAAEKPDEQKSSDEKQASQPDSGEPTSEEVAQADSLLEEARSRLEDRQSLQAELRQEIQVGERKLTAEGLYISGTPYPKLRLEYRVRVGTMQGSLLEVCDGQILHTEKSIGRAGDKSPERQFTRRDVQRILAARDTSMNIPVASQGAELGIGGLPAMLASIDRCMVGKRVTEEEFDGKLCRVFHGVWDQEILRKYDAALGNSKATVVPFFPDRVRIYFAAESYLPLKIVYLKNMLDESGKVIGQQMLMTLEFRNVQVDQPVSPDMFKYVLPDKAEEVDRTSEFVEIIKRSDTEFPGGNRPAAKQ